MRPSNIIIVSLIQSGLGWWARSLTLVNRQATSLQDSPQLLCQSETVSEVAQVCQSPFWGTHLAYSSFSASSVIPFIAPACVSLPHSTCTLSPHLFSLYLSLFFCSVIVESSCCVPVIQRLCFPDVPSCLPVPCIAVILNWTSSIALPACPLMRFCPPSLLQKI